MNESCYARIIIQGELITLSDLHLGSATTPLPVEDGETVNDVMLDCAGQPYIPGSSLRGLLRALMGDAAPELLGQARLGSEEKAGKLRVHDARIAQPVARPLRCRIKKNPVTATAEDKHLFQDLVVPRGSRFLLSLQGDGIRHSEVMTLLVALQSLNSGFPAARLGGGKSIGRGLVQWKVDEVLALDGAAFKKWLDSDEDLEQADWKTLTPSEDDLVTDYHQWRLRLHFDEPVLVNDPSLVSGENGTPDLRYQREAGRLLITGASLKGLFRARARRILMTIGNDETRVDALIDEMFGSTANISRWFFHDILAPVTRVHEQTIIAVDRFTGGVQQGAMLNLEAAQAGPAETRVCAHPNIPGWQRLLWLYCLRDLMEGDLNLGWGAARGFGAFHAELLEDGDPMTWDALSKKYENELQGWDEALQEKLRAEDEEAAA